MEAIKEFISFLKLLFAIFITADFSLIAYIYEKSDYLLGLVVLSIILTSLCLVFIVKIFIEIKRRLNATISFSYANCIAFIYWI